MRETHSQSSGQGTEWYQSVGNEYIIIPVLAASEIMATNFLPSMNAVRWEERT